MARRLDSPDPRPRAAAGFAPDLLGRQWTLDDVRDATPAQVVSAVQAGLLQDVGFGISPPAAGAVPSVKGGDARF